MIIVTMNDLPGYRVTRVVGLARGITVRSRSIVGNIGGAIQSIFGGNITVYTSLAEQARQEALSLLTSDAQKMGQTPLSLCVMMPMRLWTGLPKCWLMERLWWQRKFEVLLPRSVGVFKIRTGVDIYCLSR